MCVYVCVCVCVCVYVCVACSGASPKEIEELLAKYRAQQAQAGATRWAMPAFLTESDPFDVSVRNAHTRTHMHTHTHTRTYTEHFSGLRGHTAHAESAHGCKSQQALL